MPKAPVDENSNSVLVKHKIWVSEYRSVTAPADNGMPSQKCDESELSALVVSASNARHYF